MVIQRSGDAPTPPAILWRDASPGQSPPGGLLPFSDEARDLWLRSRAGPFQHPHWLATWWAAFRPGVGEPTVLDGHDADTGRSAVVGAWYVERRRLARAVELRRLQLVGQSTWTLDASPGEVGTLLHDDASATRAVHVLVGALDRALELDWDDFRVSYVDPQGAFAAALAAWAAARGLECRRMIDGASYVVATTGAEREYWHSRSANTRRALVGKRRLALERGIEYRPAVATPGALDDLFRLHRERWGDAGLAPRQQDFLRRLHGGWAEDVRPRISLLAADGRPVSASLNLDARGRTCNLQGGFLPAWDPRLSLGKLHLGFELSRAFEDPGTGEFDLLPGRGMRDDYKAAIATLQRPVCTYWVLRTRRARLASGLGQLVARVRSRASETPGWSRVS